MKNTYSAILVASVIAGAVIATPVASYAATISTLYNTGVDSNGVFLERFAIDPHYHLAAAPSASSTTLISTNGNDLPSNFTYDAGTYDFQTTFSLTGLDPMTAAITGMATITTQFSAIPSASIRLNGKLVQTITSSAQAINITSGFVAGL